MPSLSSRQLMKDKKKRGFLPSHVHANLTHGWEWSLHSSPIWMDSPRLWQHHSARAPGMWNTADLLCLCSEGDARKVSSHPNPGMGLESQHALMPACPPACCLTCGACRSSLPKPVLLLLFCVGSSRVSLMHFRSPLTISSQPRCVRKQALRLPGPRSLFPHLLLGSVFWGHHPCFRRARDNCIWHAQQRQALALSTWSAFLCGQDAQSGLLLVAIYAWTLCSLVPTIIFRLVCWAQ